MIRAVSQNDMCDTIIRIMTLTIQLISTVLIVAAFVYDISLKKSIATQTIMHDWYKTLVISDLCNTVFGYFEAANANFLQYQEKLDAVSSKSLGENRIIHKTAVSTFHDHKHKVGKLVVILRVINKESAQCIDDILIEYEDNAIKIMMEAAISPKNILSDKFLVTSNKYQSDILNEIYKYNKESVNEISRSISLKKLFGKKNND